MRIVFLILIVLISHASLAQTCFSITSPEITNKDFTIHECNIINSSQFNRCTTLKAQYPIYKRTDDYKVELISFNGESPYIAFNEGTALNPNADDDFFAKIDLPFKFCFFNQVYNQFVVNSNGSISFNTEQLGFESYPNFNDDDLTLNSIFAGMSDLVFSDSNDSNIYYKVIGDAPCRKFIINFYKGRLSNCEESVTSQIVLHEGTNEIEIFIKDKPLACSSAKYKQSVIGIKNNNPSNPLSIFAPQRNVGEWSTQNEAWKFSPNGSDVKPRVEWLNGRRDVIKTGDHFDICPVPFSSYTMRLVYNNCSEQLVFEKNFNFLSEDLLTNNVKICDFNSDGVENNYQLSELNKILLGNSFNGTIQYYHTESDARNNFNRITTANLTSNSQLWITINSGHCAVMMGPITIELIATPIVSSDISLNLTLCDVNFNGTESYRLSVLDNQITTDPTLKINYYSTYNGAFYENTSELFEVSEGQYSIYARVENTTGCFSVVEIKLNVTFTKVAVKTKTAYICFNGTEDKIIDLEVLSEGMLIDPLTGIKVQYFKDYYEASSGDPGFEISNLQTITEDGDQVIKSYWLRFSDDSGCFTIRELKVILLHLTPQRKLIDVCDLGNDLTESVNPHNFDNLVLGDLGGNVIYFKSENEAIQNINPIQSIDIQNSIIVWVRMESKGCLVIYPITLKLVKVPDVNKTIYIELKDICDNNNDGKENVNLRDFQSQLYTSSEAVTFTYYLGYNEQTGILSQKIENPSIYNAKSQNTIFVSVKNSSGCNAIIKLNLQLYFLPTIVLKPVTIKKCSFDSSASVEFDLNETIPLAFDQSVNQINLANLKISFFHTKEQANSGDSSVAIKTNFTGTQTLELVYVRFEDSQSGCYSIAEIRLETYLPPKIILYQIPVCDIDNDGKFEVNLLDYKQNYVLNYQDYFIYQFYKTEKDAREGNSQNSIAQPEFYELHNIQQKVWARIESIPGCASVVPIEFKLGVQLKLQQPGPWSIDDICDLNNDGTEIIDLTRFESLILPTGKFEYFSSKDDLMEGISISNPSQFPFDRSVGNQFVVRISKDGYCPEFTTITVNLKEVPLIEIPEIFVCPFEGKVDVNPNYSGASISRYEWKNSNGQVIGNSSILYNVSTAGDYSLKVVANNGCETIHQFTIKNYDIPVITGLIPNGSSYTIIVTGDTNKTIVYSKDKVTWQLSDTFTNLPPGNVTFYVKYQDEDCLSFPKEGVMPDIKNVITPNADGYNDVWRLSGLHVFDNQNSSIAIYDRYQKLLYQQQNNVELSWDGKYNGRPLPTDSYWYVIKLPDGRTFTGWILLKNRN